MTQNDKSNEFNQDIQNMTKMELREKYSSEASSHRNMMSRRKSTAAVVHDEFLDFRNFLRHLGPKPIKTATVDRINNSDREYAPGKVRWADKKTQNSNKGDSLLFTCLITGDTFTASRLAKRQGCTQSCIRSRRARGWTDAQIILGTRKPAKIVPQLPENSLPGKPPQSWKSAKDIIYERDRDYCRSHREEEGCEYFINTPSDFLESVGDDFPALLGEDWLKKANEFFMTHKLPDWWARHKPHINFHSLKPDEQDLIRQIDPDCEPNSKLINEL